MGKNKLFISTLAVAVAVASSGTVSAASAFSDVSKNNTHYDAIMELANRGIINGYGDGTFGPGNPVTRGQASKMIAGILGMNVGTVPSTGFSDVSANHEFAGAIMALKQLGVIGGYTDGTFRPNAPISRNEMAIILTRALQLQVDEAMKLPFTDVHADYKGAVAAMYKYGITQGVTETTFGGNTAVTRGQLASFIVRAEKLVTQAPIEETATEVTFVVEDIEKGLVKTADQQLKIGKTVQSFLNEANAKALTGATVQAKVVNGEVVSITALELNASGAEEARVTFDAGNTTFEGDMSINADFVELKNVVIAGNVTLTSSAVTGFATNQVEVKGEFVVEDATVSPVASLAKVANSSTTLTIDFKGSSIAVLTINRSNVHVHSDQILLRVVLQDNAKDTVINANMNQLILRFVQLLDVKLAGTGTINRLEIPERTNQSTNLDRSKMEFELLWNGTINEFSILDTFVQILISKDTKMTLVIIPDGIHPTSIFKNLTSFLRNFGKFMLQDGTIIIVQDSSYGDDSNNSYVPSPPAPTVPAVPAVPTVPTGLVATAVTAAGNDGIISGTVAGQEYRKQGDSNWTAITGPTVTGLEAGTYEVRVKATATSLASASTTVTVNSYVPAPTVPAAPTGLGTTAVTAAGNDGIISGTAAGQEYRKQGDTNWIEITGSTVTGLTAGIYEVRVKATATSLESAITAVIVDAYVPAPTVPAAPTGLGTTAVTAAGNDGIISGTAAGQEYRKQGDTNWIEITGSTVTDLTAGIYEVRVKATATSLASASTTVTVNSYVPAPTVPAAPTGLVATAVTATGNDGMISGTLAGQEYRKQGDPTWTAITGPTVTGLEADTYEVRVKATATSLASTSTTVTINEFVPAPIVTYSAIVEEVNTTLSAVEPTIAIGSTQPTGYAVKSGSLPAGLSLNPITGAITGIPTVVTAAETVTIEVAYQDGNGTTRTTDVTISITITPQQK
ncbi:hypothetical protein DCE79_02565 [Lysinibacillus sp. 2017]|uniref:S-layer homology domain-containing protein n=1 Tax=unclassified Lysinibacillus TaxID=2636778 RepID=UPI000D52814D|nr:MULTISPECIES: S-layer homology domain-containing protein [unclassified Lysinibacillus]AWE06334.1 hypothetical protein DCE79_02565 [Lysinibacillus sp. 2017]TGN34989.1 hypothetical protein E4L99_11835 [Lysinibacillus sp. S2017]